jgi:hypothetical protein
MDFYDAWPSSEGVPYGGTQAMDGIPTNKEVAVIILLAEGQF